MCKKSFVTLCRGRRKYQLFADDIEEVHRVAWRKRPALPAYECLTTDETFTMEINGHKNSLTL